jgi:hypothetical protein
MAEHRYSFEGGMDLSVNTFESNGTVTESGRYIPSEAFALPAGHEKSFALAEAAVQNPRYATVTHAGKQRSFEYAVLNGENDDGITVYPFPWGGSFNNPLGAYEMQVLAAMHPDRRFMVVNSPGAGGTDRLPPSLSKELARTGSYSAFGEYAAQAFGPIIDRYEGSLHNRGNSQGARYSIAWAGASERPVESLVVTDPVGSARLGVLGMVRAMKGEMRHSAAYVEASEDERAKEAVRAINSPVTMVRESVRLAKTGAIVDLYVRQPRALGKDGLEGDLEAVLPNITNRLAINSPELSEYSDPEDIRRILAGIAIREHRPTSIEQRVMLGHTHLYHDGNPAPHAYLIGDEA